MKIRIGVHRGLGSLHLDTPIFIGTTGKIIPGTADDGWWPLEGQSLDHGLSFKPIKGESGTFVLDHADPAQREPLSPIFFQYWCGENGTLNIREGLGRQDHFQHKFLATREAGLTYVHNPKGPGILPYYSFKSNYWGPKVDYQGVAAKQVDLIDLLRFLEGKIDLEELDKRVIK